MFSDGGIGHDFKILQLGISNHAVFSNVIMFLVLGYVFSLSGPNEIEHLAIDN